MTLTVYDHEAACDEGMPLGTRAILTADISGAYSEKPTPLRRGITVCTPVCETISGATLEMNAATFTGVVRWVQKGQPKSLTFRALSCEERGGGREVLCG